VVIKSYFDGGNRADSTQYDVVTLACVSGTPGQWRQLESDWRIVLKRHTADWLHTTDAVSLQGPFSRNNGWDATKRNSLIQDCIKIIEGHIARPIGGNVQPREGLLPFAVTVVLDDFNRARNVNLDVPKDATEILATQALNACLEWGQSRGAHFWDLYFDQGEPFMGHASDRKRSPKARRQLPLLDRIATSENPTCGAFQPSK
jgi:hypothetical protein